MGVIIVIWLVGLSVVDFKYKKIANPWIGWIFAGLVIYSILTGRILFSILGIGILAGVYWLVYNIFPHSVGGADIKVLATLGVYFGEHNFQSGIQFLFLLQIVSLIYLSGWLVLRQLTKSTETEIAFIPVIAVTFVFSLLGFSS